MRFVNLIKMGNLHTHRRVLKTILKHEDCQTQTRKHSIPLSPPIESDENILSWNNTSSQNG